MPTSTESNLNPDLYDTNPWAEYLREYRRRHPEKALQSRLNSARNLLVRNGWTVTPPAESVDHGKAVRTDE